MTVKFVHLRRQDIFGYLEPTGGITIAYDVDPVGKVTYTHSSCSNKDHYNKKIGRAVSTGRLEKGHNVLSFTKVEGRNIVEQIIHHHDEAAE